LHGKEGFSIALLLLAPSGSRPGLEAQPRSACGPWLAPACE
jgi:hypothetical protein